MAVTPRLGLSLALLSAALLAACGSDHRPAPRGVELSYEVGDGFCGNCPSYRVDFQENGVVRFLGIRGCAVPGEQSIRIPTVRFTDLRRSFDQADFFSIPRMDVGRYGVDCTVVTVTYRDDRRIHETVDSCRNLPPLTRLEDRLREAANVVDGFIHPSVEVYQRLLKSGWDVNTIGADGENALTTALMGDQKVVLFLLERGATVSRHALRLAAGGDVEMFSALAKARRLDPRSDEAQDLLSASAGRSTPVMRSLLASGVAPNSPTDGSSALLAAVGSGSRERVEALLAAGADPRSTPRVVFAAVDQDDSSIISLLARHGADVNAREKWTGRTPLMSASDSCKYWHIAPLLHAGADPTLKDNKGRSVLQPETAIAKPTEACTRTLALLTEAVKKRGEGR